MTIKGIIIFSMILLIAYPIYLWVTYIDETVTSGYAYGFDIGSSKSVAYGKLNSAFSKIKKSNDRVFFILKVDSSMEESLATKRDFDVMVESRFHDIGLTKFEENDNWHFYINGSIFDTLKLEFCDGKLCRIHRHRKNFEIP
jgi:hypothetical protein